MAETAARAEQRITELTAQVALLESRAQGLHQDLQAARAAATAAAATAPVAPATVVAAAPTEVRCFA